MSTLVDLIRRIGGRRGEPTSYAAQSFFSQGEILEVMGTGEISVSVKGMTVIAKPVTDEPYKTGSKVWISESNEGWIVHGGVR